MFEWDEKFCIGIKTIDDQHKELFRIASSVHLLLRDSFAYDKLDKIIQVINELKDYTVYHFKSEEEYMLKIKYKRFFSQKLEHDSFIETLDSINLDAVDENQDGYLNKMLIDISDWIVNHILEKDKDIASGLTV